MYKGPGKSQKDAAAARTEHPIPVACGLYYFEVTVLHKGKEGYVTLSKHLLVKDVMKLACSSDFLRF